MSDHIVYISRNRMEVLNLQTGAAANRTADFTSPRILIGNYPVAEKLLAELVKTTKSKSLFARASRLIIQPMEMTIRAWDRAQGRAPGRRPAFSCANIHTAVSRGAPCRSR
jgi:hypothetical protein